ncbi:hypothetical protein TSAR_001579 [Trichomalopsis sarcophagae]|uniref:DUF4794 domain-containing protein n=1 Tax=Trichomalopsis sarcophagae TaxID=543379 RepID=A0A232F3Z3_9HYME|nr:hypothetical protein TSAR_001579 [Trichomalopsis sarcophagae]
MKLLIAAVSLFCIVVCAHATFAPTRPGQPSFPYPGTRGGWPPRSTGPTFPRPPQQPVSFENYILEDRSTTGGRDRGGASRSVNVQQPDAVLRKGGEEILVSASYSAETGGESREGGDQHEDRRDLSEAPPLYS